MWKRLLLLAFTLSVPAWAANAVYIASVSAGGNNGTSCANAKAVGYFNTTANWNASPTGIQIGPDTTVHLCGVFVGTVNTSILTTQGVSGTSGHPITIVFEPNAILENPACGANGCLNILDDFITVDGGVGGPCTSWAVNGSNVATFQCANNFVIGQQVEVNTSVVAAHGAYFGGQILTVLAAGLSGSQFEANFTHAADSATESAWASSVNIENTDDGTLTDPGCLSGSCAVHQAITFGILSSGANTTIQNLNVSHMCMHTYLTADAGFFRGNCVGVDVTGINTLITQSVIDNAASGIAVTNSGAEVSFTTTNFVSRSITVPISVTSPITGVKLHNNHWSNPWTWDATDNNYHHNGIHVFTATGCGNCGAAGMQIYYNMADGIWGEDSSSHVTACIFINDAGVENKISGTAIFRNLCAFDQSFTSSYPTNGWIVEGACTLSGGCTPANNGLVANNTLVGKTGPSCFDLNDSSDTSSAFNNLCGSTSGGSTWHTTYPYPNGQIDYNMYPGVSASTSVFPLVNSSQVQVLGSWNSNWTQSPYNFDLHGSIPTIAAVNYDATFHLLAGSVAIGAAKNLTSASCGTYAALCTGAPSTFGRGGANDGVSLPSVGLWDAGAFQFSSSAILSGTQLVPVSQWTAGAKIQ